MSTQVAKTSAAPANDWITNLKTIAVYGIPVIVTGVGIGYGIHRFVKSEKKDSAQKDVLVLNSPESVATQLRMAFENDYYPGTDEDSVKAAFRSMPTQAFYQQVIAAYKSLFQYSFFLQLSNSLPDDLKNELDSADYLEIAKILQSKPLR